MVPKEPKVHFLIGKIYKAMGDRTKALQSFTRASNLDPKMTHIVKTTIEKLDNDNEISMTSTSVMSDTNLEGESSAAADAFIGADEQHNQQHQHHHQQDQALHVEDQLSVYEYAAFVDEV